MTNWLCMRIEITHQDLIWLTTSGLEACQVKLAEINHRIMCLNVPLLRDFRERAHQSNSPREGIIAFCDLGELNFMGASGISALLARRFALP